MKTKLLIAAALLAVAGIATGVWFWSSTPAQPDVGPHPRTVIEMQPATSQEWIEIKKINAEGKIVETDIVYRNGDSGIRTWRADGTLARETISMADGRERMNAEFAADGKQVVNGFRIREDGTYIWQASIDALHVVTTKTYWYNGQLFEEEKRKEGDSFVDQTMYYRSGAKWMHYVGSHDEKTLPRTEEIWNEDGSLNFTHFTGLNESSFDAIYRPDGTLAFKQTWILRNSFWVKRAVDRRQLLKAEEYTADGKRLYREFMMSQGGYYVDFIVEHAADGSTTRYEVMYDGTVILSTNFAADGRTLSTKRYSSRDNFKITMPSQFNQNFADTLDPRKTWELLENNPQAR